MNKNLTVIVITILKHIHPQPGYYCICSIIRYQRVQDDKGSVPVKQKNYENKVIALQEIITKTCKDWDKSHSSALTEHWTTATVSFAGVSLCFVSLGYHTSQEGRIYHSTRHWFFLQGWRLPVWWHQHQRSTASTSLLFTPSGYYRKIYNTPGRSLQPHKEL